MWGDGCNAGVCTMLANNDDMTNLHIKCFRRKDVAEALNQRQALGVDPYKQGVQHKEKIDYNAVRLCFEVFFYALIIPIFIFIYYQVFLESLTTPGMYIVSLPPVCSDPIFDARSCKSNKNNCSRM